MHLRGSFIASGWGRLGNHAERPATACPASWRITYPRPAVHHVTVGYGVDRAGGGRPGLHRVRADAPAGRLRRRLAEMQKAPPALDIAHPTGYPTYVLLGKLWSFLPIGSVAFRMNLLSAVYAAVAVGLTVLILGRLGVRPTLA